MNRITPSFTRIYSLFEQFGSINKIEKDWPIFHERERSDEVYFVLEG
ncbi:hypothetical protein [Psychrobacillus glaciei]|nr:hypothetical protein [Psychrobacillus glaciei]